MAVLDVSITLVFLNAMWDPSVLHHTGLVFLKLFHECGVGLLHIQTQQNIGKNVVLDTPAHNHHYIEKKHCNYRKYRINGT